MAVSKTGSLRVYAKRWGAACMGAKGFVSPICWVIIQPLAAPEPKTARTPMGVDFTKPDSRLPAPLAPAHTLNRKWHTSPSRITYPFPSTRIFPASLIAFSVLCASRSPTE